MNLNRVVNGGGSNHFLACGLSDSSNFKLGQTFQILSWGPSLVLISQKQLNVSSHTHNPQLSQISSGFPITINPFLSLSEVDFRAPCIHTQHNYFKKGKFLV